MAIEKVVRDFVREYYVISYLPKKKMIVFEDDNEGMICESTPNKIELGKFKGNTVYLMWVHRQIHPRLLSNQLPVVFLSLQHRLLCLPCR